MRFKRHIIVWLAVVDLIDALARISCMGFYQPPWALKWRAWALRNHRTLTVA